MLLEYADAARLYVPLTRLDLVQKYRSSEGAKPILNHLGHAGLGQDESPRAQGDERHDRRVWSSCMRSGRRRADIFFRRTRRWMKEFEDSFEFNETEDQAQAIADVKRDMESQLPMDRLLCGDVGYGKTEVAMRAAFKALSDNKQVAVLAPTTVLAFQHYETFKQRFAPFR